MRIVLASELTGLPDEGIKNWTRHLGDALGEAGHEVERLPLGRHFRVAALDPRVALRIRRLRPDVVQYVPYSHLTRNALIRLRGLSWAAPGALAAIAVLQAPVEAASYPRALRAELALFVSSALARGHASSARRAAVVPPSVRPRFTPGEGREDARRALGRASGRPLVLHVGHLLETRNLRALAALARRGDLDVVVVASTTFDPDPGLEDDLRAAGVEVVRRYVPDLERWYRAADVYVFPVTEALGSIAIPLTVLEALACGARVVTTRFGAVEEFVPESDRVLYARPDELERKVDEALARPEPAGAPPAFPPGELAAAVAAAYEGAR